MSDKVRNQNVGFLMMRLIRSLCTMPICYFECFPFDFEGGTLVLIAPVPGHCLSFTFQTCNLQQHRKVLKPLDHHAARGTMYDGFSGQFFRIFEIITFFALMLLYLT